MRGSHYTEDQNAFIVEHFPHMSYSELAKCYNAKFGAHMTTDSMGKKCRYLGLPKKEPLNKTRFTAEADAFLLENWSNYTSRELSKKLFELFGIKVATQTVTDHLLKLGVWRGSNYTPKDHVPKKYQTCKPIGTERIEKKGIVMVKVEQPNKWVPKVQLLMGYDPKKFQAIYLDGNSMNVTKENIVVVPKRIHARLAKNGWLNSSSEVILTGIKWSELLYAIQDLEKECELT